MDGKSIKKVSVALSLSIVMIVTYYKINEYAQALGGRGGVSPIIALWTPFILFAALIWWMYRTIAMVPGGQPIGALERGFSRVAKLIGRLLPKRAAEKTA